MSEADRHLLQAAGLSPSKVARFLHKSRQAVSRGVRGDADYFSDADLSKLNDEIGRQSSYLQARFQQAVGEAFGNLASRLQASAATGGLIDGIGRASRLWLILPDFVQGRLNQADSFRTLLDSVKGRESDGDRRPEVISFCDTAQTRAAIEAEFDESWFRIRRFAVLQCDLIAMLPSMVVIDPQSDPQCYVLSESGFVGLAPNVAAGRVSAIAAEVAKKIAPAPAASDQAGAKPFNLIAASTTEVLAASQNNPMIAA